MQKKEIKCTIGDNTIRKTKIICTIGPSSESEEKIKELMLAGMNCARINFSHGTHEEQGKKIDKVAKIGEELNLPIAILMDTKGPEIRVGTFIDNKKFELNNGDIFVLDTDLKTPGDNRRVGVTLSTLHQNVHQDTIILVDDGNIELKVIDIKDDKIITIVVDGGTISNRKSLNIPGVQVKMKYLSDIDKADIAYAISKNIDFIAASFVRSKEDLIDLKEYLKELNAEDVKIIAKIENQAGINNIDEIIEMSDGVMVARGDLGVETPFRYLPIIQKMIIEKCVYEGKIVVTATQMLESMVNNPRPTRAEVSDVANAVFDGTSCLMLSGETASGRFPVEAVKAMSNIAETAESQQDCNREFSRSKLNLSKNIMDATCVAACSASDYLDAKAIIIVTRSGRTAEFMSDFKPKCPIIALTVDDKAFRQLNLRRGIVPVKKKLLDSIEDLTNSATKAALNTKLAKKGDKIVVVIGSQLLLGHPSDTVRIIEL